MAERLQPALGGALLSSLRSDQLRVIAPYFAARTLAAGVSVCNEGETGDFCVVVLTGSLGVFAARECIDELRAGESWGERALFHGGLRTAELRAVQPAEVGCLTLERLGALQRAAAARRGAQPPLARLTVLKEAALTARAWARRTRSTGRRWRQTRRCAWRRRWRRSVCC